MYWGDRDLCFDGKGSLGKLSVLIYSWLHVLEMEGVAEQREAAVEVSGDQSTGLQISLTEWVMACHTQGESGQVPGMETHWELLNTEKPSWAQEVPELQVVTDRDRVLNECPCVPTLFLYSFQGVCFWFLSQHAGLDGSSVWAAADVLLKIKYCRNYVRQKRALNAYRVYLQLLTDLAKLYWLTRCWKQAEEVLICGGCREGGKMSWFPWPLRILAQ